MRSWVAPGLYVLVSAMPNLTVDAGFYVTPSCSVSLMKECAIVPPPVVQNYTCTKPIDSLSMRWTGASGVTVKAYKGAVGTTTLLGTKTNVQNGEIVTFTGFGGTPNDVQWGIYEANGTTLIGKSDFHISCSDPDMTGADDCGKPQGDGKALSGSWIQTWAFEGMSGGGKTLTCTQDTQLDWKPSCEITPQANPSCATEGKPTSLTFRLEDNDNTITNLQGGKATSTGTFNTALPVTVTAKSGTTTLKVTPSTVSLNGQFVVSGSFGADTTITLSNSGGTKTIKLHTSCSQVLAVGNEFGAIELVAFNGKTGGTDVKYRYVVQNNSSGVLTYNLIDMVGNTVVKQYLNQSLGGNQSALFDDFIAKLTGTTTNTATVTGTIPNLAQCSATASVTVTQVAPPLPIGTCSDLKPIDGLKLTATVGVLNVDWFDTTVADINNPNLADKLGSSGPIAANEVFTFSGYAAAGAPNDVDFVVTLSNGTKVRSRFHRSCSDANMNDITDCGKLQGDGKDNTFPTGNIWRLADLLGNGKRLGCPVP